MSQTSRSAFVYSVALHVVLLGVVLLVAYRSTSRAEALQPLVMDMVEPPGELSDGPAFTGPPSEGMIGEPPPSEPEPAAEPAQEASAPAEPFLRQLDIAPVATPAFEELRDVPPAPEPEPEPEPAPPLQPAPTPTPSPTPAPTPAAKPKPAPARTEPAKPAQPQMMTAADFRNQVGLPKTAGRTTPRQTTQPATTTRQTTTTNRTGTGGTGRIDTKAATNALNSLLVSGSGSSNRARGMSDAERARLTGYLNQFRTSIRAAWVIPDSVSDSGEWADIVVTIGADGRVQSVRIEKSQGSKAFLDSIRRAVMTARTPGPSPTGETIDVRYTLNLRDL